MVMVIGGGSIDNRWWLMEASGVVTTIDGG